jgi:hypothetical protein
MKMMAGEFFSASSNAFRRFDSDSPASLDMISAAGFRRLGFDFLILVLVYIDFDVLIPEVKDKTSNFRIKTRAFKSWQNKTLFLQSVNTTRSRHRDVTKLKSSIENKYLC